MHRRLTNKVDTMTAELCEQRSSRILNRSKSLNHKLEAGRVRIQKGLDIQKDAGPVKSPVPRHVQKASGSPPRLSQQRGNGHSNSGPWGLSIVIPDGSCEASSIGSIGAPKADVLSTPVLLRCQLKRAHSTTPLSPVSAWLAQAIPMETPAIEQIEPDSQTLGSTPFGTSSILSLVLGFLHLILNICTALVWALFLCAVCSPDPPWQQQVATPEANEVRERPASYGSSLFTPTCSTGFWLSLQAYAGDCFSP